MKGWLVRLAAERDAKRTESASPPNAAMRFSTFRFAVYRRSRNATMSSVFSPLIQSALALLAMYHHRSIWTHYAQRECSPSKVRVRRISPMISFLKRLASKRDDVRLMLRRKDSKCFGSVRIVIFSVVDWGTSDNGACGRGIWASKMFRTFEINRLRDSNMSPKHISQHFTERTVDELLLLPE